MNPPDCAAAESVSAAIALMQRYSQGWMDADQILPADGSCLLATLERAREGLTDGDPAAARAAIAAFIRRVERLIGAEALAAVDGRRSLETAHALLAVLRG
jgi:hypothetical protein